MSASLRAFRAACKEPWAITEEWLTTILEIAARENLPLEAVEAQLGKPLENNRSVTVRDGVATVPVRGPMVRYADMFSAISGATSIDALAQDLSAATTDPQVKAIILDVDSPGGEVNGTSEMGDLIYSMRGSKPIVAFASNNCCSAAYWIASAADRIVVADTATLGSIGVIAAVPDPTAQSDHAKSVEFVSSQSPYKRVDPTTKEGKGLIQARVDDMADVFVSAVARNRAVSTETVLSDFGQGGVFIGQKAVAAGLADSVGTYESLHADLAKNTASTFRSRMAARSAAQAPTRSTSLKLMDYLKNRAADDGIELDAADLDALAPMTTVQGIALPAQNVVDQPTLEAALEARDARINELLEKERVREEALTQAKAEAAAERRGTAARAYAQTLVAAHRLVPSAAESLSELHVRLAAVDESIQAAEGTGALALLDAFTASLPDMSIFTTDHVDTDKAALLPAKETTDGVDGKKAGLTAEELEQYLTMSALGRDILDSKNA